MAMSITAGRMRHIVEWYQQSSDTNEWGEPVPPVKVFDTVMAEVIVRSGSENNSFGANITDEVITVLTWYDPRVGNELLLKWVDTGVIYKVKHVKPDELRRGMIVTCEVQRDG